MKRNLTRREREVAHHICQGLTNREIADRLTLSPDTVHTHRKNIYKKMQVHNIASLVRKFMIQRDNLPRTGY